MKISKCNSLNTESRESYVEVNSLEGLKEYFSRSTDLMIEDIKLEDNDTKDDDPLKKYTVQVLYKDDDGYWTVGYSDCNTFE